MSFEEEERQCEFYSEEMSETGERNAEEK